MKKMSILLVVIFSLIAVIIGIIFIVFGQDVEKELKGSTSNHIDTNQNMNDVPSEEPEEPIEPEEPVIEIPVRDEEFFKDKKLVALTFDDGPNYKVTDEFLNQLSIRNAKVSFFLVGNRVINQPNLTRTLVEQGHVVGSHGYSHANLTKLDENALAYEIDESIRVIEANTGVKVKYFRPPYGSYNSYVLGFRNYAFILWSVDTNDWKYRDSDYICNYLVETVKDGDIVLLHDLYKTSVDGALCAIDILKEQGYEFVNLDELSTYKGKVFYPGYSYSSGR